MREVYGLTLRATLLELRQAEALIATYEADGMSAPQIAVILAERLRRLAEDIAAAVNGFAPEGARLTVDGQLEMVVFADERTAVLAQRAAGPPPSGSVALSWKRLPKEQLEAFVGLAGDGSPVAALFEQVGADAMQAVIDGIAHGDNPREVARQLRLLSQGSYRRMETIARTEMLRAAREASRRTYEANRDVLEGWKRACAGDARVCPVCWALHGKMHDSGDIMPTHPNCRCVMVPMTKSWADLTGDETLEDTRPTVPDAEELFGRLTEAQQREALGATRYEMWRGGTPLAAFGTVRDDARWGPVAELVDVATLAGR